MPGVDSDKVFEPYNNDELHRAYYRIAELQEDSELLADLIEMLTEEVVLETPDGRFSHWRTIDLWGNDYSGSTPRDAIAEAVKRWKGESK